MFKSYAMHNNSYVESYIEITDDNFIETFKHNYQGQGFSAIAHSVYDAYKSKKLDVINALYGYIRYELEGRENNLSFEDVVQMISYQTTDHSYRMHKFPNEILCKLLDMHFKLRDFE